jgi:hypothetical protein
MSNSWRQPIYLDDRYLRILVIATAIGEGPESAHIRDVPLMGAEGALPGPARLSSSSALSLDRLSSRRCSRHGPQSLADGFRPLVQARPSGRPTPGQLDQRQALLRQQELAPGQAGRYRGGNCPGCRPRSDRGMSQGGLYRASSWTLLMDYLLAR